MGEGEGHLSKEVQVRSEGEGGGNGIREQESWADERWSILNSITLFHFSICPEILRLSPALWSRKASKV